MIIFKHYKENNFKKLHRKNEDKFYLLRNKRNQYLTATVKIKKTL